MDSSKLIIARDYYDRVTGGEDKKSAALALIGKKKFDIIEDTPEYKAIVSVSSQLEKKELKHEIEDIKKKKVRAYSHLLDKGQELIDKAESVQDSVIAQQNQRNNLSTPVVEDAIGWDSADRNAVDNDVLEGVILT